MASDTKTASMADLSTTCWTCDPLQRYVDLSQDFTTRLGDTLHDPMLILFGSLCGLWIVISGLKLAFKMTEVNEIIKDFVFISITGLILGSQGSGLIPHVYSAALSIMGGSSGTVFSLAGGSETSSGYSGLVGLAANGEQAVARVFQAAAAIFRAGSMMELANYAYALAIIVPYFLLVVIYSSQVVVAIFRAAMVGVFAPFLFMAFAFNWGRGMAMSGAKTLLASILVLFASTAALSITIFGVTQMVLDPSSLTGDALNEFASITNPAFLVVLFLGWAGTALMTEGTSMANSIAGTALTNAAAGILTGGAAATGLFIGKKGLGTAGLPFTAGGKYGDAVNWVGKQFGGYEKMAEHSAALVEKFKNVNKPDGGADGGAG